MTGEVIEVLSSSLDEMPGSLGTLFMLHELRGPSAGSHEDSVFGSRDPHFMFELVGMAVTQEGKSILGLMPSVRR